MDVDERQNYILTAVVNSGSKRVKDLIASLPVSPATVRRDIVQLEQEGVLCRRRGSVFLAGTNGERFFFGRRFDEHARQKIAIARRAAALVDDGDIIFIGAGNTCLEIARLLANRDRLTVVTNSFLVVIELLARSNIKLVFLGGDVEIEHEKPFTSGLLAKDILENIYIKKSFITVNGVSLDYGYSIENHDLADLYATLTRLSQRMIVVADSSKFDKKAFRHLCDLDAPVRDLVTNSDVPPHYADFFAARSLNLFLAGEE